MTQFLFVGAGGFLGAVGRYGMSLLVARLGTFAFPWATFAVNVLGCLVIGALLPSVGDKPVVGENGRLFFVVGLLGGFTTFSAFGYESLALLRKGSGGLAAGYVLASVLLGLGAVWLGRLLAASWVK